MSKKFREIKEIDAPLYWPSAASHPEALPSSENDASPSEFGVPGISKVRDVPRAGAASFLVVFVFLFVLFVYSS